VQEPGEDLGQRSHADAGWSLTSASTLGLSAALMLVLHAEDRLDLESGVIPTLSTPAGLL
jgi:hypothetical protein